jgi:hypothetical protein
MKGYVSHGRQKRLENWIGRYVKREKVQGGKRSGLLSFFQHHTQHFVFDNGGIQLKMK